MRLGRRLLCGIALLAALPVYAATRIDLIAPRAEAVLEGGQDATIVWSADSLPGHVEEWEAFLSLDGGAWYSVRITPHLDANLRSFRWRVPNIAATDARILIRIGNERHEEAIEFPRTFSIVPGDRVAVDDVTTTTTDGERALPTAPPVVEWVSGDRSGAHLVTHRQRDRAAIECANVLQEDAATADLSEPLLSRTRRANIIAVPFTHAVACPVVPQRERTLLLVTMRLNI